MWLEKSFCKWDIEKEYSVFDKVISDLAYCWENADFNWYPVRIKVIICGEDNFKWGNYSTVKDFFKALLRDLHRYKDLKNECKSMFRHLDQHSNKVLQRLILLHWMAIQRTRWSTCNIWFSTTSPSLWNISWRPLWHISSAARRKRKWSKIWWWRPANRSSKQT